MCDKKSGHLPLSDCAHLIDRHTNMFKLGYWVQNKIKLICLVIPIIVPCVCVCLCASRALCSVKDREDHNTMMRIIWF